MMYATNVSGLHLCLQLRDPCGTLTCKCKAGALFLCSFVLFWDNTLLCSGFIFDFVLRITPCSTQGSDIAEEWTQVGSLQGNFFTCYIISLAKCGVLFCEGGILWSAQDYSWLSAQGSTLRVQADHIQCQRSNQDLLQARQVPLTLCYLSGPCALVPGDLGFMHELCHWTTSLAYNRYLKTLTVQGLRTSMVTAITLSPGFQDK